MEAYAVDCSYCVGRFGAEMQAEKRNSGIDLMGYVPWGTHVCMFYETSKDLAEILVPYVKAGLENNEFCMWITSEPLQVEEAKAALKKAVINLDDYIKKEQIEILDYSEWYTRSGKFDADEVLQGWVNKEKLALEKGLDGLRLTGNTFWLEPKDWKDFNKYEIAVAGVIAKYRMLAICSYSLEKCSASDIMDVMSSHRCSLVRREGRWQLLESVELKRMEESLSESRENYRNSIENSPLGIRIVTAKGEILYANQAILNIYGYSSVEELVAVPTKQRYTPESYAEHQERKEKRERGEFVPSNYEIGIVRKDGEVRHLQVFRKDVVWDGERQFQALYEDITERKQVEQALRDSEEKYRLLAENATDVISVIGMNLRYVYISPSVARLRGYTPEEALAQTQQETMTPASLELVMKAFQEEMAIENTKDRDPKRSRTLELELTCKDGSTVWTETKNSFIRDKEGRATGILGVTRDINQRKRAEQKLKEIGEKLHSIFESVTDGIMVTDLNGVVTEVNAGMVEMCGFSSSDKLLGRSAFELIAHQGRERARVNGKKLLEQKSYGYGDIEYSWLRADGSEFPVELAAALLKDVSGKPIGFVGISRDITERRRVEEELRASREQLRSLSVHLQSMIEKERKSIAREIHDELGQALTALKIDLAWLSKKLPKEQESSLKKARAMSELIDTTIHTVKRLSSQLRPGLLDDLGIVAAMEWQVAEFQERTGIKCETSFDPAEIILDQDRSTAVFRISQETLTNVARHANATRVKVSLKEEADKLVLKIRDNGKGIREEQASTPGLFGIMGMRERARAFGGEVKIAGIPGKGTSVELSIPLKEERRNAKNTHR